MRESLKNALDAINYPANDSQLAEIINHHMPEQVMEELQRFSATKGSRTVYVIHNLPEQEKDTFTRKKYDGRTNAKILRESYSWYIQHGIAEALKLRHNSNINTFSELHVRHSSTHLISVDDDTIHKDGDNITLFGGLVSDGTPTRFIDLRAVLDDVRQKYPDKESLIEYLQHALDAGVSQLDTHHYAAIQDVIPEHAQKIVVKAGSLALWPNDGDIFHQALASRQKSLKPEDGASRIMVRNYGHRVI